MAGSPIRALVAFEGLQGRTLDDGNVVTREVVLGQQLANFHFDQFEQFSVVHHVALVQEDDDVRDANLTGQQDVLTGLRHRAVSGRADQDGAVHLGSTGNHVLDVVSVTRAVNVGVVTSFGFVLNVCGVNGDTTCLLFRRRIDLVVGLGFTAKLGRQNGGDRSGQRRLTMVNVTNRAHVYVRLCTFKLTLCHF